MNLILNKKRFSSIITGPPGCGKTVFARLIASLYDIPFEYETAVSAGIPELREIIKKHKNSEFLLVIDEVHRFTRTQQDFLLPMLEKSNIMFIGLTTENPYAALSPAIRSRVFIFRFYPLKEDEILRILKRGVALLKISVSDNILKEIANFSQGDARIALNSLEWLYEGNKLNSIEEIKESLKEVPVSKGFIKEHYDLASAFIKSVRGSDPDAALYYLARLLDEGEDPLFIARRLIILASEDIGLASLNALQIAVSSYFAVSNVGMPEAALNLAHAALFLSLSPKSNTSLTALMKAKETAAETKGVSPPFHLLNIPQASELYKYPHNFKSGYVKQVYFPEKVKDREYYTPKKIGYEKIFAEYFEIVKKVKNSNE